MPTFDVAAPDEFARWLRKGLGDALGRGVRSAGLRVVGHIQNDLIPNAEPHPPVDRAAYRAGWHLEPAEGLNPQGGVEVVNSLPYADTIDRGARAENIKIGRKMIEALTAWVLRKGFDLGKNKKAAATQAQAESIAWAIAVAMKKRGIFGPKGLQIGAKAARYAAIVLLEEVQREVARVSR